MLTVVDPRKHLFCEKQHLDLLWETSTRSRMFLKFLWRSFRQWALYSVPKIARARLLLIGQLRLHSITWRPSVTHVLLFFFSSAWYDSPYMGIRTGTHWGCRSFTGSWSQSRRCWQGAWHVCVDDSRVDLKIDALSSHVKLCQCIRIFPQDMFSLGRVLGFELFSLYYWNFSLDISNLGWVPGCKQNFCLV